MSIYTYEGECTKETKTWKKYNDRKEKFIWKTGKFPIFVHNFFVNSLIFTQIFHDVCLIKKS